MTSIKNNMVKKLFLILKLFELFYYHKGDPKRFLTLGLFK